MNKEWALFIGTFTTLLAIINPLQALPVYLQLMEGKDQASHRGVALRACVYATLLLFFFLIFGAFILNVFGVPLSMVRIVGGIILTKIGFELFAPSPGASIIPASSSAAANVAFVPLAMPIMCGPGAIATVLGMQSQIRQSPQEVMAFAAIAGAILAAMVVTFVCLSYAGRLAEKLGPMGIDAATRIVGFFVSAIGVGLVFNGVVEGLREHGVLAHM
ncbi:MarC family protein [Methylocella sp.]|uniref:MarC family protein n=1 Tax=Methylocella sp. TaxID=1978226 RepID=UPI0035AF3645